MLLHGDVNDTDTLFTRQPLLRPLFVEIEILNIASSMLHCLYSRYRVENFHWCVCFLMVCGSARRRTGGGLHRVKRLTWRCDLSQINARSPPHVAGGTPHNLNVRSAPRLEVCMIKQSCRWGEYNVNRSNSYTGLPGYGETGIIGEAGASIISGPRVGSCFTIWIC